MYFLVCTLKLWIIKIVKTRKTITYNNFWIIIQPHTIQHARERIAPRKRRTPQYIFREVDMSDGILQDVGTRDRVESHGQWLVTETDRFEFKIDKNIMYIRCWIIVKPHTIQDAKKTIAPRTRRTPPCMFFEFDIYYGNIHDVGTRGRVELNGQWLVAKEQFRKHTDQVQIGQLQKTLTPCKSMTPPYALFFTCYQHM